jgi:putative hydrolase of the HAD superfamily
MLHKNRYGPLGLASMPMRDKIAAEEFVSWIDETVRAVFFDAIGTLLAPAAHPARTYTATARRYGAELPESLVRERFMAAFQREEEADEQGGWRVDEERERQRWRRIVATCLSEVADVEACFRDLWEHFSRPEAWQPHPEAAEVLGQLDARGLVVGIASNFDARLRSVLDGIPVLSVVRGRSVISSLVGIRKPAPHFFQRVAACANSPPQSVLFVGDHPRNDVAGARAAGLRAVLYNPDGKAGLADAIRTLRLLLPS